MTKFESSLEHLQAELKRIDLRLRLEIMRLRLRTGQPADDFRGLYISEGEIDTFLGAGSVNDPAGEIPDLIDWASQKLDETGIVLREVDPKWGVL